MVYGIFPLEETSDGRFASFHIVASSMRQLWCTCSAISLFLGGLGLALNLFRRSARDVLVGQIDHSGIAAIF